MVHWRMGCEIEGASFMIGYDSYDGVVEPTKPVDCDSHMFFLHFHLPDHQDPYDDSYDLTHAILMAAINLANVQMSNLLRAEDMVVIHHPNLRFGNC